MNDPRRRFSKKERSALFLAADGKSDLSGDPLGDHWHSDHIVPWSKGGATDVANAQALTERENLVKSNKTFKLRNWQQRFVDDYHRSDGPDYLLAALPGGGKTIAALHCAKSFLNAASRRLIIVAPTKNVQEQWRDEAKRVFNLELLSKDFSGHLQPGFDGVVTTYQAVSQNADLFRRFCSKYACMAILDEIHHAGDKTTWGERIKHAFENSKRRLCLSGTPFRSDGKTIPFLTVGGEGFYKIDFTYDYPRALQDGVIREVAFHRHGGSATGVVADETVEYHTDDQLDDDETARRLRWLLRDPDGTYTRGFLEDAHNRLVIVRRTNPNAGGLALCIDANHAVRIALMLEEVCGEAPDIVVSDNDLATGSVKAFRKSSKMWIVAVRMVSEGVDIKRLMVLAYLTNTATELFFRQAVGRIVRSEGTDYDTDAVCIIPDDPRLVEHATKIEEFQAQIIEEDEEAERRERDRIDAADRELEIILGSSDPRYAGMISRGSHYEAEKASQITAWSRELQIPEAKVAALIEKIKRSEAPEPAQPSQTEEPLEEKMARLKRQNNKLTSRLAYKLGMEPQEIHREYIKIANVRQGEMTLAQLEDKRQWLVKRIDETKQV